MKNVHLKNVLLIRMDKIGDLIVTLPVDQLFLNTNVTWFIANGVDFIPQNSIPPRRFCSFSKQFSWTTFFNFIQKVKELKPDAAVVFHAPAWVGVALWLAGVPKRVGVWSKFLSFFVFNKGVRQRRSISDRHELAYNLDLISRGLGVAGYSFESIPRLTLIAPKVGTLQKFQLSTKQYIVVHPGMAGSAMNWSVEKYIELIEKIPLHKTIVITGTQMDRPWVEPLQKAHGHKKNIIWLNEKINVGELLEVLESASVVLAPSTGVIHIAASLGTPVVGIYSPKRVETPIRWGPLGRSQNRNITVFTPRVAAQLPSGQITHDVMNSITSDDVFSALKKYI